MADVLTPEQRSRCMSHIRGKDTKPEWIVRKLVHALGYRYRLHDNRLPGKPDLVFAGRKKVIFVHGCYWHRHDCSYGRVQPKTRQEFWKKKFAVNVQNDAFVRRKLEEAGWRVFVVWECQTKPKKREELCFLLMQFISIPSTLSAPKVV